MAETKAEAEWPGPLSELAQNKYPGLHDKEADQLVPTATSGAMRTIIGPKWQLISHDTLGDQLYDWQRDPGEVNDLISTPEGKAAALNLKLEIERTTKDSGKKK
jgi:hypothetical protein